MSTRPSNPDKYVEDVNERPVAFWPFAQYGSVFCQEALDVSDDQRLGERIVLIAMKRGLADECGCQKENAARIYGRKKCKQFHSVVRGVRMPHRCQLGQERPCVRIECVATRKHGRIECVDIGE